VNTRRKDIQLNLPNASNNSSALVNTIARLLGDGDGLNSCVGYAIPAPRIFKALSSYDDPEALHDHLSARWAAACTTGHPTPAQEAWLSAVRSAPSPEALATALLTLPRDTPSADSHSSWKQLLNPYTTRLASTKTAANKRHVLRLTFNSQLVTLVVRHHLGRYEDALRGKSDTDSLPLPIASWARDASRDGVLHAELKVSPYYPRFESTRVTGWTCGPEHVPSTPYDPDADYSQLYGNTDRLGNFLRSVAPHCHPSPPVSSPDGTGIIDFIHEKRHRHELYRLLGRTAPEYGIHRPLKLKYYQRRTPTAQCCSLCGEPDHQAHSCPRVPPTTSSSSSSSSSSAVMLTDASMDAEEKEAIMEAARGRHAVCRDCYSPDHQQSCYTPAEKQHCKLCQGMGHTSFRCKQYRPSWVLLPAPKPEECRPLNPRPLTIIAQQQGSALPSWSSIAAGGRSVLAAPQHRPTAADFPALPGSRPPTPPASYAATAPPSPSSPSTPLSPSPPPSAELAELKTIVTMQQQTLQALQALHQQSVQHLQASMEAANQRAERRFDELFSVLGFFKQLLLPNLHPLMTPGMGMEAAPPLHSPSPTPVCMQSGEHKATDPSAPPQSRHGDPGPPQPIPAHTFQQGSLHGSIGTFGNFHLSAGASMNAGPDASHPSPPAVLPPHYSHSSTASSPPSTQ
jgi:hypothetical protein